MTSSLRSSSAWTRLKPRRNPWAKKFPIRKHAGFDHSYFFISSFMADHVKFHADALNQKAESALVDVAVTDDAALAEFAKTAGKPIT